MAGRTSPQLRNRRRDVPLVYTALDLSKAAPGPSLIAEDTRMVVGFLIGLPLSLVLWALIWALAAG